MSLSNLFEPNDFNIKVNAIDAHGPLEVGKDDSTTSLHLGNTSTPVYINELLYTGSGSSFTIAPIGTVPNVDGMTLSSGVLNLQPANSSVGGVVSNTTQTFLGQKTFNTGIVLNNITASYVPAILNYYEESFVVNGTSTGPWVALAITLKFTKIGKRVTMQFSSLNSLVTQSGNALEALTIIPTRFIPSQLSVFVVEVVNGASNSTRSSGIMQLDTFGNLYIVANARTFFSSTYAGLSGGCITYLTA